MTTTATKYVKSVDEDSFDPVKLDLYWRFIAERQRMYVRRTILGLPAPWTVDTILQNEFITNMYRELDPGTQYVLAEILEYEKPIDVVFNVMMYRLMGSVAETHQLITQPAKGFDPKEFIKTLRKHKELDMKVFGDAYRVAAYQDEGGEDKIENVANMFAKFSKQMPEIMRRLKAANSTRDAFDVFKGLSGMGEFLAHQITVDLLYGDTPVLPFGQNEWAQAGPGARNGIWSMLKPDVKPNNLLMVMQWLQENQRKYFSELELDFPYILDDDSNPVELSLCNIQSTLCEYYKYVRIWTGETKGAVRKYDASKASVTTGPPVAYEDVQRLIQIEPSATPPRPDSEAVADAQEAAVAIQADSATLASDGAGYFPGTVSSTFTSPDGRQVTINININLGS